MADDGHWNVGARTLLLRGKRAAERQSDAKRLEETGSGDVDEDPSRAVALLQADEPEAVRSDGAEQVPAAAQELVVGPTERTIVVGPLTMAAVDAHQLGVDVADSRLEQERVDDAERGRVDANAERQHEDGDEGEGGLPPQQAETEGQVLNEASHEFA